MIWEHELPNEIEYNQEKPFFHTWQGDATRIAFVFPAENEAHDFYKKVANRSKYATKVKEDKKEKEKVTPTKKSKKGGKIDKSLISGPSTGSFKHVAHMGFDSEKGFSSSGVDPSWQVLLEQLSRQGISPRQIQKNQKFIEDFVEQQGGIERVGPDGDSKLWLIATAFRLQHRRNHCLHQHRHRDASLLPLLLHLVQLVHRLLSHPQRLLLPLLHLHARRCRQCHLHHPHLHQLHLAHSLLLLPHLHLQLHPEQAAHLPLLHHLHQADQAVHPLHHLHHQAVAPLHHQQAVAKVVQLYSRPSRAKASTSSRWSIRKSRTSRCSPAELLPLQEVGLPRVRLQRRRIIRIWYRRLRRRWRGGRVIWEIRMRRKTVRGNGIESQLKSKRESHRYSCIHSNDHVSTIHRESCLAHSYRSLS